MNSEEFAEQNPRISRRTVDRLLAGHSLLAADREEFEREMKADESGLYDTAAVLAWLGY